MERLEEYELLVDCLHCHGRQIKKFALPFLTNVFICADCRKRIVITVKLGWCVSEMRFTADDDEQLLTYDFKPDNQGKLF